jgi:hypothetical protein
VLLSAERDEVRVARTIIPRIDLSLSLDWAVRRRRRGKSWETLGHERWLRVSRGVRGRRRMREMLGWRS